MLKLRALERDGRQLRLRRLEHRLGLGDVQIGGHSPGAPIAGQLKRFGEDLDTGGEDRPLGIQRAQHKVIHGHFRLDH